MRKTHGKQYPTAYFYLPAMLVEVYYDQRGWGKVELGKWMGKAIVTKSSNDPTPQLALPAPELPAAALVPSLLDTYRPWGINPPPPRGY
jgi:hypothetical protein